MEKTSRFNYIKRGLVGVCAATMLTGLCAGTAFALEATNGESTTGGGLASDASASSTVSLGKDDVTANISATVPTTLPVAVADGVFTAPTGASITNTSTGYGVKVTGVSILNKNTNLNLIESTGTLAGNDMWMTLAAGSDTTSVIDLGLASIPTPNADVWKLGTTEADKTINIKVEGAMGALSGALLSGILDGTSNTLFEVSWTISPDLG
ncbi:hypothetical protein [Gordonibacter massiliensis (ex Traore et al. 2017)]|uniref:WxL domain-containing protein n=1 Tax=Gordonibacter massiliensis (ex Traore et al. 2017) TaxID=1841863 RepID=A0A842JAP3_9ACTN|nr:hypothetical protein [Gordonibacter massiliensis (ex Traore et al. 2017)]MBC2888797.1 hypothetical protein [Gordonibacter massiliensis (ex Traore et al. 2017)]